MKGKQHGSKKYNFTPLFKSRRFWSAITVFPRLILTLGLGITLIGFAVVSAFFYFFILQGLPSADTLRNYERVPVSTHLYDRNGKLLYEIHGDQNRTPVKLAELPPYVSQASIAIEDKDFFRHSGVSLVSGVLRAVRETYVNKSGLQGGSTITQQLVKSALLSSERTFTRKLKEIVLALEAERRFSKQEILEFYLNQIPYGGSNYGIESTAQNFFGKHAKDLSIAEAALLAGLPQLPSRYSPYLNPDLAIARRNDVLQRMLQQKYITEAQYNESVNTPLQVIPPKVDIKAPHFVFYVKEELEREFGSQIVEEGGLKVITTLDLDIQQEAEKILREEVDAVKYLNVGNGAVLVTRPPTGEILAMVGSVDYFASPSGSFNLVTSPHRQPGSSIKPIIYAIGLDRKLVTAASIFLDSKTCFQIPGSKPYCPVNYDLLFHGPVTLRNAVGNSFNIPAVKMMAMNGVASVIASAPAFLMDSVQQDPSKYGLSFTLGGVELPMKEMAQAYSAFANRGKPKRLQHLVSVTDKSGKLLFQLNDPNFIQDVKCPIPRPNGLVISGKKVISEDAAFVISHILLDNSARITEFGPNSQLVIPNKAVSVKTGTTDDKRDNWTIGYTPNFLTAVWVGNNDNSPMNQRLASGITGAAPIWNRVMQFVLKNQPDLFPVKPEGVVGRQICAGGKVSGKNPDGSDTCQGRFEYFIKGSENALTGQTFRGKVWVNKDTGQPAAPGDPNAEEREQTMFKDAFSGSVCVDCAQAPTPNP